MCSKFFGLTKVLVIDNFDSFTYNLVHYLEDVLNDDVTVVRNNHLQKVNWDEFTAVVVSPGPGLPKESNQLMESLKFFIHSKKVLGVCLGLQAIVEYFGGNLQNLGSVFHGLQTNCTILVKQGLFKDLGTSIKIGRYHSWISEKILPENLQITAEDDIRNIMAIKHKTLPVYGVQFHPESVLTPDGKTIIKNWLEI